MSIRPWNRKLWGVTHGGGLLGSLWDSPRESQYEGEPTRTLLFVTRSQARTWCKAAEEKHRYHSPHWKFRAVRVREIVKPTNK